MSSHQFRRFLLTIAEDRRPVARFRYRESLGTQILGALALSLGLAALLRYPDIWRGADLLSQSIRLWLDPPPASRMPYIPPFDPAFARYGGIALVGQFLGIAGAWRSRKRKGSLSLVSLIGILACTAALSPIYLLLAAWAVVLGWPFLLAIAAPALLVRMIKLTLRA